MIVEFLCWWLYSNFILQKSFFLMQAISTENDTLLLDVYDENKLVRLMLVCFVRVLAHLPLHSFTITFIYHYISAIVMSFSRPEITFWEDCSSH